MIGAGRAEAGDGAALYPEIYVLRHGQTEWNLEKRHQGSGDSPLTDLGHRQAAIQGEILRTHGVAERRLKVFSSPQARARHTADIVVSRLGCAHHPDPRLVELAQGAWEGLLETEVAAGWPEVHARRTNDIRWFFDNPTAESFQSIHQRATDFLACLSGPCVIVTHGITSHILRGIWLGLDLTASAALPGGQGCVYHLRDGKQRRLEH